MNFLSFTGIVTGIHTGMGNCTMIFTVENERREIVNFVIQRDTYFVDHVTIKKGDRMTGYYDANAPAILIYPPQFTAIVIAKESDQYFVKVSYFDESLVSDDGQLKLNISKETRIQLENAQQFQGDLGNQSLIVLFGPTTRSIPAQTTPYQVIVLCE